MRVMISRYGAFGDIIHCSHLPRLFKDQGWDVVDFETNWKGYQLLKHNPFIDNLIFHEPSAELMNYAVEKHWQILSSGYDRFVNLYGTLERGLLAMEDENIYYMGDRARRNRYSKVNFYDQTTAAAGYPELAGIYLGEVFYPQHEIDFVKNWMKKFEGKFIVLINLCGTGPHKEFVAAREVAKRICEKYHDVQIITTGDEKCKDLDIAGAYSVVAKMPFVQALLTARFVDLVIGCESGLMVGASMWGTPAIQLLTAASLENHVKYARNDFSLQSPTRCSPCHRGPYKYIGCPSRYGKPLCVFFDVEKILEQVDKVYASRGTFRRTYDEG